MKNKKISYLDILKYAKKGIISLIEEDKKILEFFPDDEYPFTCLEDYEDKLIEIKKLITAEYKKMLRR